VRQFSFYHRDTGELHGKVVTLNVPDHEMEQAAASNAPADHLPISGTHDWKEKRVDISTAEVVQREGAAPKAKNDPQRRMRTLARISELERNQARRVCELLAERDPRLKAMDEEIQALRADLKD
jgi:hypothetical protein